MSTHHNKNQHLKEIFTLFDHDGNGHVTAEELKHVLRKLGYYPTDKEHINTCKGIMKVRGQTILSE